MQRIISHAVAKVNLMLNVTGKSGSGYHNLESVFVFLDDIYDTLEISTDKDFVEECAQIPGVPTSDNSITLAARILRRHFKFKIPKVVIRKTIPLCGGLGGGSSDAACFVNSVLNIYGLETSEKLNYLKTFKELGSDAMVFLYKYFTGEKFVYLDGTGIDGTISHINLDLTGMYILLINNGTSISTREVFNSLNGRFNKKLGIDNITVKTLIDFHNSLQEPAIKLEPSLNSVLHDIKKTYPIFCGISGSGSTCFGIYENLGAAEKACSTVKYNFKKISKL